jgi:Tetratricopeptide repeat.
LLLLALLSVRKGWKVHWMAALLLAAGLGGLPEPARAGALADAFFTADQQGRWAFEHERYPQAAAHFRDPFWKGLAAYRAADYELALASFARLDSAQAYFYLGNTYVRLSRFDRAVGAYRQALARQADFPQATANLALAQALEKDRESQQKAGPPSEKPDQEVFDNTAGKGRDVPRTGAGAESDEQWLNNLSTSPAQFLRRKFQLQDAATGAGS